MFFELFHLKDVMVVVFSRMLNNKKIMKMETIKSICLHLLIGTALTLLGSTLLMVASSVGVEGE